MINSPFDACWDRLERADQHRSALAKIWNDYLEVEPFDFSLVHEGGGVHVLRVWQDVPIPSEFALELGEWLYNLRACLDYIVWATCAHVTQQLPPPDEGTLQYPIYDHKQAWDNNLYRLKHLRDHHRDMLWLMQPCNSDSDANYLGVINRLARIDRQRRLTITTGYLAEMHPVVEVPNGCTVDMQWGQRVLIDGEADMLRLTVSPWSEDTPVRINPRSGIDPDVAEWAASDFWRRIRFSERLVMIQAFMAGDIAAYEYDCCGTSRKSELLTESFVNECDNRTRPGPIKRTPRPAVEWTTPVPGRPSTQARFDGHGFPSGSSSPDRDT